MEIWCYMVFLPFYWDIGFSGKLKSKIRDGISLAIYGNLALYGEFTLLLGYRVFRKIKIKNLRWYKFDYIWKFGVIWCFYPSIGI